MCFYVVVAPSSVRPDGANRGLWAADACYVPAHVCFCYCLCCRIFLLANYRCLHGNGHLTRNFPQVQEFSHWVTLTTQHLSYRPSGSWTGLLLIARRLCCRGRQVGYKKWRISAAAASATVLIKPWNRQIYSGIFTARNNVHAASQHCAETGASCIIRVECHHAGTELFSSITWGSRRWIFILTLLSELTATELQNKKLLHICNEKSQIRLFLMMTYTIAGHFLFTGSQ